MRLLEWDFSTSFRGYYIDSPESIGRNSRTRTASDMKGISHKIIIPRNLLCYFRYAWMLHRTELTRGSYKSVSTGHCGRRGMGVPAEQVDCFVMAVLLEGHGWEG